MYKGGGGDGSRGTAIMVHKKRKWEEWKHGREECNYDSRGCVKRKVVGKLRYIMM
jgi:hypothetical protein